ncbi:MAG: HEAT repeat domain-containing protein [Planctomycetota bacterium]|jgi:hypothetical protein
MEPARRPDHLPADARGLCAVLRDGLAEPAPAMDALRAMGDSAVPALREILDEREAGYGYAVRVLGDIGSPDADDALRGVCQDANARDCDRLEAAQALLDRGDAEALETLRRIARRGDLRAAAYYCLRDRPDGFADEDLALGPYLDNPEIRPLVVEDLLGRGYETGGSLDDESARERFREGWRAGTVTQRAPGDDAE